MTKKLALVPLALLLAAGCGSSKDLFAGDVFGGCYAGSIVNPLALQEPGESGYTPQEVMDAAVERLSEQRIRWEAYGAHPSFDDTLTLTFSAPTESYEELLSPANDSSPQGCAELSSAVVVQTTFHLTSSSGHLSVPLGSATIRGYAFDGELLLSQHLGDEELSLGGPLQEAALDFGDAVQWRLASPWIRTERVGNRQLPIAEGGVIVPTAVGLTERVDPGFEYAPVLLGEWIP